MRIQDEMPEFSGITRWFNGEVSKQDLLGRPSIIQFWSISCGPCKESLPKVKNWFDTFNRETLNIVGIHMPRSEEDKDIEKVRQLIEEKDLRHPIAVDNDQIMTDAYENLYVPAFYLFDEEGKLRHFQVGTKVKMLEQRLEKMTGVMV